MRQIRLVNVQGWQVSIHASVKDATNIKRGHLTLFFSFNPRICKRCDYSNLSSINSSIRFNPRICKRCDVNIKITNTTRKSFNPRICKRCDSYMLFMCFAKSSFNPRICKRCDQKPTICYKTYFGFNPRICKRCDYGVFVSRCCLCVSIHASVKDATNQHPLNVT